MHVSHSCRQEEEQGRVVVCTDGTILRKGQSTLRATPARRRAGIILLNCRNSETCNKKEKTPLHDLLDDLPVQTPLSERAGGELQMQDLH